VPGVPCIPNPEPATSNCICDNAVPVCEGLETFPECDAPCPAGQVCQNDGLRCHCVDVPVPCEESIFPLCTEACPNQGEICVPDESFGFWQCLCTSDPPNECVESLFPNCDLPCPDANEACIPMPEIHDCWCGPKPCADSLFPACEGLCPAGTVCRPGATACDCVPLACADTAYPSCDGNCPQGQDCVAIPGTVACACAGIATACESLAGPVCDAQCSPTPSGLPRSCKPWFGTTGPCHCIACLISKHGVGVLLKWKSKEELVWTQEVCAETYNVYRFSGYRMIDQNQDGLADYYGTCLESGIPGTSLAVSDTPIPGVTDYFVITGVNELGEGPMGFNSNRVERTNSTPCQ
jgi:hypothetical protein